MWPPRAVRAGSKAPLRHVKINHGVGTVRDFGVHKSPTANLHGVKTGNPILRHPAESVMALGIGHGLRHDRVHVHLPAYRGADQGLTLTVHDRVDGAADLAGVWNDGKAYNGNIGFRGEPHVRTRVARDNDACRALLDVALFHARTYAVSWCSGASVI